MNIDALAWHIAGREERSEWDALFIHAILEWLKVKAGRNYRKILDVPCGNARLHPFLLKFGYKVYGFDISEELIREGMRRNPNVWKGDMRDWKAYKVNEYGQYDVVVNWFTSFGYFDDETNKKVLEHFYKALTPNGVVLIDLPAKLPSFKDIQRYEGFLSISEGKEIDERRVLVTVRVYKDIGDALKLIKRLDVNFWYYPPEEMTALLREAGFREIFTFETYRTRPPNGKSQRITYVAIK